MKVDYFYLRLVIVALDVIAVLAGSVAGKWIAKIPGFVDWDNPENPNTPRMQLRKLQGMICLGFGACSINTIGNHTVETMLILVIGVLVAELFNLADRLNSLIIKIIKVFIRSIDDDEAFVGQVIESTMISIAGALSVFSSLELAVNGDPTKMILKVILDLIGCTILASSGNPLAIAVSALPIGVYQFAWFVGASVAAPYATLGVSEIIGGTGGMVLVVVGLYLLGIDAKLKSADYILVMLLPFLASAFHLI